MASVSSCASISPKETPKSVPDSDGGVGQALSLNEHEKSLIGFSTAKAETRILPEELEFQGIARANPNLTMPVVSLVPGNVEMIEVEHGTAVKKGEIIAKVRSDEVGEIESEFLRTLVDIEAEGEQERVKLALAEKVFNRKKLLVDEKIAARAELDIAEGDLEQARAAVKANGAKRAAIIDSVKQRLRIFGIDDNEVQRILRTRDIQLSFEIRAPQGGIVLQRLIDPGEIISAGQRLFEIADLSNVWLVGQVYEEDLRFVKVGQPVKISLESYPGDFFRGKIDFVDSHVDSDTRTLPIRANIDNPQFRIKPEMFARLSVNIGNIKALTIPAQAVQKIGETNVVYVVAGGNTYLERKVEVGRRLGENIEIKTGLQEGETVVVKGSLQLLGEAIRRLSR